MIPVRVVAGIGGETLIQIHALIKSTICTPPPHKTESEWRTAGRPFPVKGTFWWFHVGGKKGIPRFLCQATLYTRLEAGYNIAVKSAGLSETLDESICRIVGGGMNPPKVMDPPPKGTPPPLFINQELINRESTFCPNYGCHQHAEIV